jgi:hypothetical protein
VTEMKGGHAQDQHNRREPHQRTGRTRTIR